MVSGRVDGWWVGAWVGGVERYVARQIVWLTLFVAIFRRLRLL